MITEASQGPIAHPDVRTDLLIPVPQDPLAKTLRRKEIMLDAENDAEFQCVLLEECRRSVSFFAEMFVWSEQQTQISEDGQITKFQGDVSMMPWQTWPVHERLSEKMRWCEREGQALAIAKSRDMRITWWLLIESLHRMLFSSRMDNVLLMSKTQDDVDSADFDALFPRMRYILDHLPPWMHMWKDPPTFANLTNTITGSRIDGKATTESGGVGGRKSMIVIDEAARHPHLRKWWNASRDVCQFRVLNSTPYGPGTFKDEFLSGNNATFIAAYYHHPEKGRGAEWRTDETGIYTRKRGTRFIWTPWLEREVKIRTPEDVAANIMVDFDTASGQVFDSDVLNRIRQFAQDNPPDYIGTLLHRKDGAERDISLSARKVEDITFEGRTRGDLQLWCGLNAGRPPADRAWCIFADVSNGLSQSNSVAAIGDANTGEKLGQFTSASTDAAEFARVLAMLGLWFQGVSGPALVGWESNGPGGIVGEHLRRVKYPRLMTDESGRMGWHSSKDSKRNLIENLSAAYRRNEFHEVDVATVAEAQDYVYTPSGGVEPVKLQSEREARGTHGDRVIATAGLWMLMQRHGIVKPERFEDKIAAVDERWRLLKLRERKVSRGMIRGG